MVGGAEVIVRKNIEDLEKNKMKYLLLFGDEGRENEEEGVWALEEGRARGRRRSSRGGLGSELELLLFGIFELGRPRAAELWSSFFVLTHLYDMKRCVKRRRQEK